MTRNIAHSCIAVAIVIVSGCSGGDGPSSAPQATLRIVSGAAVTDTVLAQPAALAVQLVNEGKPAAGVVVKFQATSASILVGGKDSIAKSIFSVTTDASGNAVAPLAFSSVAESGVVLISASLYNLVDTARITILPGAAAAVTLAPADTFIGVTDTATYRAGAYDHWGNLRSDPATFSVTGNVLRAVGTKGIQGLSVGDASVSVSAALGGSVVTRTGMVHVVPSGTIAYVGFEGLTVAGVSGARPRVLVPGNVGASAWSPDGSRIVFEQNGLSIVDMAGNITSLPLASLIEPSSPEFSPDGSWIYFQAYPTQTTDHSIYRIHPDGTGLGNITVGSRPAISPDGRTLAFETCCLGDLVAYDVATHVSRVIATGGARAPRWSPDGQWLAYLSGFEQSLVLIHVDGSSPRRIGSHGLNPPITWSPDSKWLLGTERSLTLVNIETGDMTYLPYVALSPSWRK